MKSPLASFPLVSAALAAIATLSTGCASSMVPLTQELRAEHDLTERELKNLQLYTSDTITLRREVETGGKAVTGNHRLLLRSGKTIEEIVIEAGTPGVAVGVDDHSIDVSFAEGTSIRFGIEARDPDGDGHVFAIAPNPDPFPGNHPDDPVAVDPEVLLSGSGNYWLSIEGSAGEVIFGGRAFQAVEESLQAHLMLDAESLEEVVERKTVLGGREL